MAEEGPLEEFRRRWRAELSAGAGRSGTEEQRRHLKRRRPAAQEEGRSGPGIPGSRRHSEHVGSSLRSSSDQEERRAGSAESPQDSPGFFELAESLLEGSCSPVRACRPRAKRRAGPGRGCRSPETGKNAIPTQGPGSLVEQLISDLNEINEIPFFDIQLPYELALQIFQYLGRIELGRCAQVSKTWKVLAEDEVLWYRVCQQEGYLRDAIISDYPCWKHVLQDCRVKENTLRTNWKNRIGAVSQLQYELGKVLCDVHSFDGVVIAGYTSGDVRLWDTRTWNYTAPILEPTRDAVELGCWPHVSFVRINSSLAVAAYEDGSIDIWSLLVGREPIHHYQHNQRIQALALDCNAATVASASSFQVRVECPDDNGYWRSLAHFEVQKLVNFLHVVPDTGTHPVTVAAAEEIVYVLKAGESDTVLHSVYGHPVTCLDVSANQAAFGVKSFGWLMNEGNKIQVYNLHTSQCSVTLGNSAGDFTCISLKDSPPNMLVTGNKDRRVRVYDLRSSSKPVCSLYAHQLGVSAAYMDDWKIVSGGEEGLVCVWDQRMGTKLWEIHARHPVRHIWFNAHSLITANVPDEKKPRGASIMDDDLTAHCSLEIPCIKPTSVPTPSEKYILEFLKK
ncbi:F-box/WD repeat-containing protein 8 isoform X2 [Rhinatrema bivittatum]|uniref:F-box/WD repeat-containing protein 8 isoform X2 n=1 Tax=Rhinatrema bivittatum TaxID=194408 RepID=UPI00112C5C8A|nr:F-box/WD repeat-containing protein 8 isoform X2 [Rhinatrema bivittatum]